MTSEAYLERRLVGVRRRPPEWRRHSPRTLRLASHLDVANGQLQAAERTDDWDLIRIWSAVVAELSQLTQHQENQQ